MGVRASGVRRVFESGLRDGLAGVVWGRQGPAYVSEPRHPVTTAHTVRVNVPSYVMCVGAARGGQRRGTAAEPYNPRRHSAASRVSIAVLVLLTTRLTCTRHS